jgi:hypothetical protein
MKSNGEMMYQSGGGLCFAASWRLGGPHLHHTSSSTLKPCSRKSSILRRPSFVLNMSSILIEQALAPANALYNSHGWMDCQVYHTTSSTVSALDLHPLCFVIYTPSISLTSFESFRKHKHSYHNAAVFAFLTAFSPLFLSSRRGSESRTARHLRRHFYLPV